MSGRNMWEAYGVYRTYTCVHVLVLLPRLSKRRMAIILQ